MITASLSVRPRINANGAICIVPLSMYSFSFTAGSISSRASYRGCRYGSILSFMSPGRNPSFSPASTAGLDRISLRASLFFSAATARAIAMYVFPVPAGPRANVRSLSRNDAAMRAWLALRGAMGLPFWPNIITPADGCCLGSPPLTMSIIISGSSLLYFAAYASISFTLRSNSAVSPSSPITLITLPRAAMRSFGNRLRMSETLALLTP